jgi:hypothetical protein
MMPSAEREAIKQQQMQHMQQQVRIDTTSDCSNAVVEPLSRLFKQRSVAVANHEQARLRSFQPQFTTHYRSASRKTHTGCCHLADESTTSSTAARIGFEITFVTLSLLFVRRSKAPKTHEQPIDWRRRLKF